MQVGDRVTVTVRNGGKPEGPYIVDDLSVIVVVAVDNKDDDRYPVHRQTNGKYQMDEFVEDHHKICSADGIKITDELQPGEHIFVHMMDANNKVLGVKEYKVLEDRLVRAYDPYTLHSYEYFREFDNSEGAYFRTSDSHHWTRFYAHVQYAPFSYDRAFARQLSPETRSLLAAIAASANEKGKISYYHRTKDWTMKLTGVMIGIKSTGKAGQKIFSLSEQVAVDMATFSGVGTHYPLEMGPDGVAKQNLRGKIFLDVSNIYQVLVQARLPYEYVKIVPKREGVEYAPEQLIKVAPHLSSLKEMALQRWTLYWLPVSELKDYLAFLDD